jgi:hypothetical protein
MGRLALRRPRRGRRSVAAVWRGAIAAFNHRGEAAPRRYAAEALIGGILLERRVDLTRGPGRYDAFFASACRCVRGTALLMVDVRFIEE